MGATFLGLSLFIADGRWQMDMTIQPIGLVQQKYPAIEKNASAAMQTKESLRGLNPWYWYLMVGAGFDEKLFV